MRSSAERILSPWGCSTGRFVMTSPTFRRCWPEGSLVTGHGLRFFAETQIAPRNPLVLAQRLRRLGLAGLGGLRRRFGRRLLVGHQFPCGVLQAAVTSLPFLFRALRFA